MAGTSLAQAQIDALVAKLQYYKYVVSFGEVILGPLKSSPKIEADMELKEIMLYETGSESQASILGKNNAKIALELEDVDQGMTMLAGFKKGDNVLDSTKSKPLTLVPIAEADDTNAKTLTFGNCFLQPGLSPNLAEGDDPNHVPINFLAKPVEETGLLYTFA